MSEAEDAMPSTVVSSPRTRRWTRHEYERLIELGVFQPGERLELIDGLLVVREPQGARHATAIRRVLAALRGVLGEPPLSLTITTTARTRACGYARPVTSRRTSFVPATNRLSFSAASHRGTGKKPQSGMAESFSGGMNARQRRSRSATSSGVSM